MTERDLARILHRHVQDVHLSDEARRNIRQATKEEQPVNMKKWAAVIIAALLMLTVSVGIAAELGLFEFLSRKMGQTVLPEANELLQTDVACGETDDVIFTVKQAVYDGNAAALLVEMRAKDEKTFLMGASWWEEDPIGGYIYNTEAEALAEQRTVAQYAADHGYTRLLEPDVSGFNRDSSGIEEWNDNVLTVLYSFSAEGDALVIPFEYVAYDRNTHESQRTADEITLKASAPLWTVSSDQHFDAPGFGIRVDGITITGTPVQSYWTVHYTVTDAEIARKTPWNANVVDMGKQYIDGGVLGGGGSAAPEYNGQQLTYTGAIKAMETPPEQLMILLRNWDDHSLNNYFPVDLK